MIDTPPHPFGQFPGVLADEFGTVTMAGNDRRPKEVDKVENRARLSAMVAQLPRKGVIGRGPNRG
jgi:hypothetical protein